MDGLQIQPQVLNAIFLDRSKLTPQIIQQVVKWHQQLEPSVNLTKSIISAFLIPQQHNNHLEQKEQSMMTSNKEQVVVQANTQSNLQIKGYERLEKAIQNIPQLLNTLQENKCPKNFTRAFLLLVKQNYQKISHKLDKYYILQQWSKITPELLESYFDTFNISISKYSSNNSNNKLEEKQKSMHINAEQFDNRLDQLIHKRQYNNSLTLIKMSNCQKQHINKLLSKMTNNKQASKAADYIKQLKLDPNDYPALGQRLYKNTARHFLSKNGWEYAEQIFQEHPQALACIVQDLIFKKKFNIALSVWYRHPICWDCIVKQDSINFLKPYADKKGENIKLQEIKDNFLHKDVFGPNTKGQQQEKYLSLQDLGFVEKDLIWIDQKTQNIQQLMKEMTQSSILGIDTQSIVGQTKFQKSTASKFQQAALIQIATKNKIYMIDGLVAKTIPSIKNSLVSYIKNNGLIVGHTLDNDMQCLLKSIGCEDQQIKQMKNIKVIDVWKLFKSIYPKKKYSSLAFITKEMLGKQLNKDQTLTNWKRRPLRRNQLHYAAMDAVVVIKIYEKFVEEFGQNMIQYYCEMDANEL